MRPVKDKSEGYGRSRREARKRERDGPTVNDKVRLQMAEERKREKDMNDAEEEG